MLRRYILKAAYATAMVLLALFSCITQVHAQSLSYTEKAKQYIEKYKYLAISEQRRTGVPASIILGQGILETEAGCSELVTGANNHFGIKCKSGWLGETFTHTDDAPDECFRKYNCAEDSYRDHSDYLKNTSRYSALFQYSKTDYASWAVGLKKCGYATNPKYAQQLIKIIEDFHLQDYTYAGLGDGFSVVSSSSTETPSNLSQNVPGNSKLPASPQASVASANKPTVSPASISNKPVIVQANAPALVTKPSTNNNTAKAMPAPTAETSANTSNEVPLKPGYTGIVNGLKAFYVYKGEMLLQYAINYNVRYEHLLEINDLPDAPVPGNMYIYLERKNNTGMRPTHVVKQGESLIHVAQHEGIQLRRLMSMNHINWGEEPVAGEVLQLQEYALEKPKVVASKTAPLKTNNSYTRRTPSAIKVDTNVRADVRQKDESVKLATASAQPMRVGSMHSPDKVNVYSVPEVKIKAPEQPADTITTTAIVPQPYVADTQSAVHNEQVATSIIIPPTINPMVAAMLDHEEAGELAATKNTALLQPTKPIPSPAETIKQPLATVPPTNTQKQAPVTASATPSSDYIYKAKAERVVTMTPPVDITSKPVPPASPQSDYVTKADIAKAEAQNTAIDTAGDDPIAEAPAKDADKVNRDNDLVKLKAELDRVVYNKKPMPAKSTPVTAPAKPASAMAKDAPAISPARQESIAPPSKVETPVQPSVPKADTVAAPKGKDDNTAKYYTVKTGDTAYSIAKSHGITMRQLMNWNDLDFDEIKVGQRLKVKE